MGTPDEEDGHQSDESPQHQVTLRSFYMGKYEVTQGEWYEVMGTKPSHFTVNPDDLSADGWKSLPVENVSWYDAVEYCNRMSLREGLSEAYVIAGDEVTWRRGANGYRLPTEAEWEYACRAGTSTPFSTGDNITTDQANYDGEATYDGGIYRQATTEAGHFAANPWGLYDMHGNVLEWCWDIYGAYPEEAQNNPTGFVSGDFRVTRGGSWYTDGYYLRSGKRSRSRPSSEISDLGFRLVRPVAP